MRNSLWPVIGAAVILSSVFTPEVLAQPTYRVKPTYNTATIRMNPSGFVLGNMIYSNADRFVRRGTQDLGNSYFGYNNVAYTQSNCGWVLKSNIEQYSPSISAGCTSNSGYTGYGTDSRYKLRTTYACAVNDYIFPWHNYHENTPAEDGYIGPLPMIDTGTPTYVSGTGHWLFYNYKPGYGLQDRVPGSRMGQPNGEPYLFNGDLILWRYVTADALAACIRWPKGDGIWCFIEFAAFPAQNRYSCGHFH